MSIVVKWIDSIQSILIYEFPKTWDWTDFEQALEIGFGLTESVSYPVTAIFDLSQTRHMPDGVMIYWRKMLRVLPSNQRVLICASNSKQVQTTIKLFLDINKRYTDMIQVVDSIQHARILLSTPSSILKTILIVEDEDPLREEIAELMELEGFHVLEASNGFSALKLAQDHLPDLIISDVTMPHMDGFQLIESLRKHPDTEHLPVVLLTARADRHFMRHGMNLGADDYITKPFSSQELTESVKSRLRRLKTMKPSQ